MMAILFRRFGSRKRTTWSNFEILSPKGTSHTNFDRVWEMKVLLSKFQSRTNLSSLFYSNLGSRNKTTYFEFGNFEYLREDSIQIPNFEGHFQSLL
jgi:hypothetical protein